MNLRTMKKLENLGFDSDWLLIIKNDWKPKKTGVFEMLITHIEDLDDNPAHGIFIERTKFDNAYDLSVIHHFFEGNAYVITDMRNGRRIGSGIIDYSPFEEMEEVTGTIWPITDRIALDIQQESRCTRKESMINSLTRENNELREENAKLRLELKYHKRY